MRPGFTLVEIMVVAAITVLIATIILVAMGESRNQAKDAALKLFSRNQKSSRIAW